MEWYANGIHKTKSCGNAAKPESFRRARQVLADVMRERIAVMESQVDQMMADAEIGAVNGKVDELPP